MPKLADVQKFILWLSGSVAIFGCISTLILYVMYNGGSKIDCNENDVQCLEHNQSIEANKEGNEILRIISPTAIGVGITVILLVRCWQQKAIRTENERRRIEGEANDAYNNQEFELDSPPSYSDALGMDAVLEAHGSFPEEAPPKYSDIVCAYCGGQSHNSGPVADGTHQIDNASPDTAVDDVAGNNDDGDSTVPHSIDSPGAEENCPPVNEEDVADDLETSTDREEELYGDNEGASLDVEGQNSPSQDIRIFVRQRDSNLSAQELGDINDHTEEIRTVQSGNAGTEAVPQVDCTDDEVAHSTVPLNETSEHNNESQSSVATTSSVSGSRSDSELHPSASAVSLDARAPSQFVTVIIGDDFSERNNRSDSSEQINGTSTAVE